MKTIYTKKIRLSILQSLVFSFSGRNMPHYIRCTNLFQKEYVRKGRDILLFLKIIKYFKTVQILLIQFWFFIFFTCMFNLFYLTNVSFWKTYFLSFYFNLINCLAFYDKKYQQKLICDIVWLILGYVQLWFSFPIKKNKYHKSITNSL